MTDLEQAIARAKWWVDYCQHWETKYATFAAADLRTLIDTAERVTKLEAALREIAGRHIPDQPAADGSDEADYVRKHHAELRRIARAALTQEQKP